MVAGQDVYIIGFRFFSGTETILLYLDTVVLFCNYTHNLWLSSGHLFRVGTERHSHISREDERRWAPYLPYSAHCSSLALAPDLNSSAWFIATRPSHLFFSYKCSLFYHTNFSLEFSKPIFFHASELAHLSLAVPGNITKQNKTVSAQLDVFFFLSKKILSIPVFKLG